MFKQGLCKGCNEKGSMKRRARKPFRICFAIHHQRLIAFPWKQIKRELRNLPKDSRQQLNDPRGDDSGRRIQCLFVFDVITSVNYVGSFSTRSSVARSGEGLVLLISEREQRNPCGYIEDDEAFALGLCFFSKTEKMVMQNQGFHEVLHEIGVFINTRNSRDVSFCAFVASADWASIRQESCVRIHQSFSPQNSTDYQPQRTAVIEMVFIVIGRGCEGLEQKGTGGFLFLVGSSLSFVLMRRSLQLSSNSENRFDLLKRFLMVAGSLRECEVISQSGMVTPH
eukprot:TRINITY_DN19628_c0_g1_i2.p1 TRINITY_DN19628_c0_g1~~TRINITY_DN19628_c0_g1_i2.p1  ORF type:complete len:282 (+),score=-35.10 TRINITY_DN19628_c0_g1_i2:11-856(+)